MSAAHKLFSALLTCHGPHRDRRRRARGDLCGGRCGSTLVPGDVEFIEIAQRMPKSPDETIWGPCATCGTWNRFRVVMRRAARL
jgi:hypothetical protein